MEVNVQSTKKLPKGAAPSPQLDEPERGVLAVVGPSSLDPLRHVVQSLSLLFFLSLSRCVSQN